MDTLIPGRDPQEIVQLQHSGSLEKLVKENLDESQVVEDYEFSYTKNTSKTRRREGTYFELESSSLENIPTEIGVPIESEIEHFYANNDLGAFRIERNDGEQRDYQLVMSSDDSIVLKGEVGFGEREMKNMIYHRGDVNHLQVKMDGWCKFGEADKEGQGNTKMTDIETIDEIYRNIASVSEGTEEKRTLPANYSNVDARKDIRILDEAFSRLSDNSVNSLVEFESKKSAAIDKDEHPFSSGKDPDGIRGRAAAKMYVDIFSNLHQAQIIDYKVNPPKAGASTSIEIDSESLEGLRSINDLKDQGCLSQEEIEEIVNSRFK